MQMRTLIGAGALSLTAFATSARAVNLYQLASVDLTPLTPAATTGGTTDIGSAVSSIAWDGSTAYVGGLNNGAATRDTALINVTNVLTTPTFGTRYGVVSTPSGARGYLGLDYKAGVGLADVFDSGTAATSSIGEYNPSTGTAVFTPFAPAARPPAGPSYDPVSNRLSYIYQGTSLIRNVDAATGAATGNADTTLGTTYTTAYRDFDYASNGDFYARTNNEVVKATRSGASSFSGSSRIVDNTDANNVGENIGVVEGFGANSLFAIYNDKASNSPGQAFTSVVRAVTSTGTAVPLSFLTGDGSAASPLATSTGVAYYDFSYDAATQTLAVLDFSSGQLYIFGATSTPEPASLTALGGVGLLMARRRRA